MGQLFEREDLLQRVEMIIDSLFDLIGLKQYGEVSQKQLVLFQRAISIRQQLTIQLKPKEMSKQEQYIETIEENNVQLNEFKQMNKYQKQCLQQGKQRYGQLRELIELLYVGTCDVKYTESLIRSNVLLNRQINELNQILSKMQEELSIARQNNQHVADMEQNTVTKDILLQFQEKMKLKIEEKQHFEYLDRRVDGEYQHLMDQYKELLQESNEGKMEEMRTSVTSSTYKETSNTPMQTMTKQPKTNQAMGNQMLNIKVISQPANCFYEQIATIVLLFVTVFIVLSVGFK